MDESRYLDLMAKHLSGEISEEEQVQLSKWRKQSEEHQTQFEEAAELWSITEQYDADFREVDVPAAWNQVEQQLDGRGKSSSLSVRTNHWSIGKQLLRIAAVFLVVVAATYSAYQWIGPSEPERLVFDTPANTTKLIHLPDGSSVLLNEQTRLSYLADFEERIVELEGEAFFDVSHQDGKRFEIYSGNLRTVVLGTSFNVRAYPQEEKIEVTVESGKVAVEEKGQKTAKPILLLKGNTGVYDKGALVLEKSEKETSNATAWKTRKMLFNNTNFREVKTTLERYFNIEIEVENPAILDCHVDSNFDQPSFEQVVEVLEFILAVEVEEVEGHYVIRGEGC